MVSPVSVIPSIQPAQNAALPQTPTSSQPDQTPAPDSASASPATASGPAAAPVSQQHLDATLKDTGFKGEIDTSDPSQIVVRIVDDVTGKTVVQIPSMTALAFAQALRKSTADATQLSSGALMDEAA